MPNSETTNVFAGVAGVELQCDTFEFEYEVTIKKCYAHFMAPFLLAFAPAPPGAPHPAPWKSGGGGLAFDIHAEIFIPHSFSNSDFSNRLNTAWWILSLIRLYGTPLAFAPVVANQSFSQISSSDSEPSIHPMEIEASRIVPVKNPSEKISLETLEWVKKHWLSGHKLFQNNDFFSSTYVTFDQVFRSRDNNVALIMLWGAIERLLSVPNELRFRLSSIIASFLESPGEKRYFAYQKVKKLYDSRSRVAHGSKSKNQEDLFETYEILKRLLIRIIEDDHVPTRAEFEAKIFGA